MTRSMTRTQNPDDASRRKKIRTCDNGGVASWSELNHDVLYLVMMRLGVVDFVAFSGVCKSWRSFTFPNRNVFMASKPPMLMYISTCDDKVECYLEDFEGRKFKTLLPHSEGRTFVGSACGYLILFGMKTRDFWLVNPITRHELYFPFIPNLYIGQSKITSILVFSPSISRWVFVILKRVNGRIWFSINGKGEWNRVSSTFFVYDLHAFKGKIYTKNRDGHLCEMRLNSKPNMMLLEPNMFSNQDFCLQRFVSSSENLYVMEPFSIGVHKLDFCKMKLVPFEETNDEFFLSNLKPAAAVKPDSWAEADPWSQYRRYNDIYESGKGWFFNAKLWYFPHECFKVHILNE